MAKVQISIDDNLLKRLDNFADNNYMSRSGFITVACTDYLNQKEAVSAIRDVSLAVRKIADTGTMDKESMETLENFERLAKLFSGAL